jgi:aspartyl-tRNA(Asn)/glutamyl-tRNA(Gln) amidotransferase subunit A
MAALDLAISDIALKVQNGELQARALVEEAIKKLESTSEYQTTISLLKERGLTRADELDAQLAKGKKIGTLAGVPFVAKDNFLTFSGHTTAASHYLKQFEAPYQATAIEKLETAGAICVAKTNLDAWAHGSSTENSDFFITKNPHDKSRVPGGSSGGSAAAVALKAVPFAIGTDTGGSIRLPASFCGVVGYKPTYGLVSRSGVVAMASSTDVIGPLARTVEDAAIVLDAMAGKDELDSTTIDRDEAGYKLQSKEYSLREKRVGIIKEFMSEGLDSEVKTVVSGSIEKIRSAGAHVSEISLPSLPLALAVYYIICPAEVSSNLARYDGQRYGYSSPKSRNLEESYFLSRETGFGAEAKRRIMIGSHVLSSGYYDAYYKKAQTVRTKLIKEFNEAFNKFDLLVGPTAPNTAFKIGERANDPLKMYLSDIMTVAANITGNPAISLPAGKTGNLPVGLQIIAPQRADRQLLAAATEVEGLI